MGVANNNADPFTPSWEINVGYWQWGRKFEAAAGPTGSGSSQANSGSIAGWSMSEASNNAWLDNSKTVNDPCPAGYRVPTKDQWQGVLANNTFVNVGTSWSAWPTNYSSGKRVGNTLFLPAAGYRSSNSGELDTRGAFGYYWSSTQSGVSDAWSLDFDSGATYLIGKNRTYGQSVRCIEE
jgi:uncharacterized protein (TIGR02145 family)